MQDKRLRRRHPLVQFVFDNWIYILVLIFLWRFPYLVADWTGSEVAPDSPRTPSASKFWQSIMIELFILAILSISYNLMFGFTGVISFGHGVFFGTGAYGVAVMSGVFGQSFVQAILVALAFGIIYGLIWAVAAFRVHGVYFAMFSLAFSEIFFMLSRLTLFDHITRGDDGLRWQVPDWISPIHNRLMLYNIALFLLLASFLLVRRLMNSPSGKVLIAIRENEERAQTLGFNIYLYKTLAITVSAFLATLAGILHAILNRQVAPSALGLERTVDPLLMTLIGGTGSNPGPVIGATALRIGEEFLRKPELVVDLRFIIGRYTTTLNTEQYWSVALGTAFVLFVMFVPYGVVGSLNQNWLRVRRWGRAYLYNPLVKRYPQVAVWAELLTGEPPEVAQALAADPPIPLLRWAMTYPVALMNGLIVTVPVIVGLTAFDWRPAAEWLLFLLVVSIPLRIGVWAMRLVRRSTTAPSEQASESAP